jgi:hypothetical protein
MATAEDLRAALALTRMSLPDEEVQRLAPVVDAFSADMARLERLPLEAAEPAFTAWLSPREP